MAVTREPGFTLAHSQWDRLCDAASSFVLWGIGGLVSVLAALQFWLLPDWSNEPRFYLALGVAVCIAFGMAVRRYVGECYAVALYPDVVEFRRGNGCEEVRYDDVVGLIGRGGISLDGGEMVVWKRLLIATENRCRSLAFSPEDNAALYRALRGRCLGAWGIPFRGPLEPPEEGGRADLVQASRAGLGRLGRLYRRQVAKTAVLGLALAAGSLAMLAAFAVTGRFNGDRASFRSAILFVVLFVVGLLLLAGVVRDMMVVWQIRREAKGLMFE